MKYSISFQPSDVNFLQVEISDNKIIALQSLLCSDIQTVGKDKECHFLEWLVSLNHVGETYSGNSCAVEDLGDQVIIEDQFYDLPTKILIEKTELILVVKQWIRYCEIREEMKMEVKTIRILE